MILLFSALIILLSLYIFYRRKLFLLSPLDFFVIYFTIVIILTTIYHFYCPTSFKFNFFEFDLISNKKFNKTMLVFLKMMFFFLIGVFLFYNLSKESRKISRNSISLFSERKYPFKYKAMQIAVILLLFFSVALVFMDYGFEIFRRSKYIPKDSSYLKTIYQNMFLVISILSGVIFKKHKITSLLSIIISLILALSIGSRYATIYLLSFGIVYAFLSSKNTRKKFLFFFIPFSFLFFGYNVSLRSEASGHGLLPYLSVTMEKPYIIYKYSFENLYYTFVFGFYATADTLVVYKKATIENLITCLSPLPGSMTRWYMIAKNFRSNLYAPFTSIGELGRFPNFSIVYYIFLGYYFTFIDTFIKKQILQKKYLLAIPQFLFLVLFVILSFEYNLRSSNRFIYYSIILYVACVFFSKLKFTSQKK